MISLIQKITEHILGKKYYAVVLADRFDYANGKEMPKSLAGYIFRRKEDATTYYYQFKSARSRESVEIISFRSRKDYKPFDGKWLINANHL